MTNSLREFLRKTWCDESPPGSGKVSPAEGGVLGSFLLVTCVALLILPAWVVAAPRNDDHMDWMAVNGESIYGTQYSPVDHDFWWGAMTRKERTLYLHVLEWMPEGIEFNGIVGRPTKAYFLADPHREALPVSYDGNGHITRVAVPPQAPDSRNTVIAVEFGDTVVTDPQAAGKYHWYTNRRTRHTDIQNSGGAGRHVLPQAVTGN